MLKPKQSVVMPPLLPFSRPNSDFLGGKYKQRAMRGGGGVSHAQRPKVLDRKALTEFLFQIGLPYRAPGALKKRRGAVSKRNPEVSAKALSREFTALYR
jgi:hypothetical protein